MTHHIPRPLPACRPVPPGRPSASDVDGLVCLVFRRAYEGILDGEAEVTLRDAAALLKLQCVMEHEAARRAARTIAQWGGHAADRSL